MRLGLAVFYQPPIYKLFHQRSDREFNSESIHMPQVKFGVKNRVHSVTRSDSGDKGPILPHLDLHVYQIALDKKGKTTRLKRALSQVK